MDAKELQKRFRAAIFKMSTPEVTGLPADRGFEVAFAGRSNAGKSSALNTIAEQSGLARVSKTPGRTQQLVLFDMDFERRLVDLPGYGYAKVPQGMKESWGKVVEQYLMQRQALRGVVLLVDIRHPLRHLDRVFLDFAAARSLPCLVLLTKSDKLSRGPALQTRRLVQDALRNHPAAVHVELFSAPDRVGVEEARWVVATWLGLAQARSLEAPRATDPN